MIIRKNNISFNIDNVSPNVGWWTWLQSYDWEPFTFDIIDKVVFKNSICLDVGAWIGPITLYLSQICNSVHSIEPDKIAYAELILQSSVNKNNINLYNLAIMDYDGDVTLGCDAGLGNSITRLNQQENNFNIQCNTLSTFVKNNNISSVDFIKIDIEGSEEYLLKDMSFFKQYKPTIYLQLHPDWISNYYQFKELLTNYFNMYTYVYDMNCNIVSDLKNPPGILTLTDTEIV